MRTIGSGDLDAELVSPLEHVARDIDAEVELRLRVRGESAAAMAHLADIGTIVYLRASYETVASRVTNLKGRGVTMKPGQTLRDIYDERKALYEKFADRIIDVDTQSIESTAQHLAAITRAG